MQNSKKLGSMNEFMDLLCHLGVPTLGLTQDRNKLLSYLAVLFGDLCYTSLSYMLDSVPSGPTLLFL